MKLIEDDTAWVKAFMETPFGAPHNPKTAYNAMMIPSCALKSKERGANGFPKLYGKLVFFNKNNDMVVVRGLNSPISGRFVWEGSVSEYFAFWDCD